MSGGPAPGPSTDVDSPLRLFVESPERAGGAADVVGHHQLFTAPVEEAPGDRLHHDGSFGAYMDLKKRKLDEQFASETALPAIDELFKGVSIHVNGLTDPSHAELRRLMSMHGGAFKNYYSRSTVTHIICSNLPDAKVKAFEKERNPTPFVRPEWITASILAGRLLPVGPYVLERTRGGGAGQRTLAFGKVERPSRQERLARAQAVAKRMRDDCQLLKGPPKSSRDDPNFVESFYRASRLHFIGTWKTRLEKLMQSDIVDESPVPLAALVVKDRTVVHVDMDCFFASVAEASHAEFQGLPLAVCHSNARGSGEISSANYEARKSGIHASMFMARAKELCPELIVVPYEFEKYEVVSETVFRIFLRYTSAVQAISCDEAFLDVTGLGDPMDLVSSMRRDIHSETGCRASAGIGPNMLLARLATAKAKPDGQYHLKVETALGELAALDIEELPGIGWRTGEKLRQAGFEKVLDIQKSSKAAIQSIMGAKAGSVAYEYAFGRDERCVTPSRGGTMRKSVGAEVNWGVRFDSDADAEAFLLSIAQQVGDRLTRLGMCGGSVTLKIKKRREGAQEPRKFLGMGICDSITRSAVASRVQSIDSIFQHALPLLRSLRIPYADIRGVGLSVSKLAKAGNESARRPEQLDVFLAVSHRRDERGNVSGRMDAFAKPRPRPNQDVEVAREKLPAAHRVHPSAIDESVLAELPEDLQLEIRREYGLVQGSGRAANADGEVNTRPTIAPVFAKSKKKAPASKATRIPKATHKTNPSKNIARPLLTEFDPVRMSQVDVDVLRQLPVALQQEVTRSLKEYGRGFKRKPIAHPPPSTDETMAEAVVALQRARHDLNTLFDTLRGALDPILQEAAKSLHAGSSTGFLSKLETWMQARSSVAPTDCFGNDAVTGNDAVPEQAQTEHPRGALHLLADLVTAELESPVSSMSETTAWSLARGLLRLEGAYNCTATGTVRLSAIAAEIVARRHHIIV